MISDDDRLALSRLALGDLPAEAAATLRQRIDRDPELAEVWWALKALPDALAAVADEPPPAHVIAATLAPEASAPWRSVVAPWLVGLAAGALLALRPAPPAEVQLVPGAAATMSGSVEVTAADLQILVSGRAEVAWEPVRDGWRVTEQTTTTPGADMDKVFVGMGIGAVVAVTVWEGSAQVFGADLPQTVHAGDTLELNRPAGRAPVPPSPRDPPAPPSPTAPDPLAARNAELAFENALLRGSLERTQGLPSPWPADVEPRFREAEVRSALSQGLDELGTLAALDCDEYPCIALLDLDPAHHTALTDATEAIRSLMDTAFGTRPEDLMVAEFTDGDGVERRIIGTLVMPPGSTLDEGRQTRTEARARSTFEDLVHDAASP